jgi:hypothetical protein
MPEAQTLKPPGCQEVIPLQSQLSNWADKAQASPAVVQCVLHHHQPQQQKQLLRPQAAVDYGKPYAQGQLSIQEPQQNSNGWLHVLIMCERCHEQPTGQESRYAAVQSLASVVQVATGLEVPVSKRCAQKHAAP